VGEQHAINRESEKLPEGQSFEEALTRLERIVDELESGEQDLDMSLVLFQEGIGLARLCSKKLDEAEAKIELLLEETGDTDSMETVPFDSPEEVS